MSGKPLVLRIECAFKDVFSVVLSVFEDLSNKTVEAAAELPTTMKFIQDTFGVVEDERKDYKVIKDRMKAAMSNGVNFEPL